MDPKQGSLFLKLFDRQIPLRRLKRRQYENEFTKASVPSDTYTAHPQLLMQWIFTLAPDELGSVFAVENAWMSDILRKMHIRNLCDGDGLFSLKQDISIDDNMDMLDNYFTYIPNKLCFLDSNRHSKRLESAICFLDTSQYLDTFSICQNSREDLHKFLQYVDDVSKGRAFKTPCRVYWDNAMKVWVWDCPEWFDPYKPNFLAAWALVFFEKRAWARYWEYFQYDPRRPEETSNFIYETPRLTSFEENWEKLSVFWSGMDPTRRKEILGDLRANFDESNSHQVFAQQANRKQCHLLLGQIFPMSIFMSFEAQAQLFSLFNSKHYFYMNRNSVEELEDRAYSSDAEQFIRFLLTCSLDKAGTPLSQLCRLVTLSIMTAQTEQIAEDLLEFETKASFTSPQKRSKQRRRKRPRKSVKSQSRDVSTNPPSSSDDDPIIVSAYFQQLVSRVFQNVISSFTDPEPEQFIPVTPKKKGNPRKSKNNKNRQNKYQKKKQSGFHSPIKKTENENFHSRKHSLQMKPVPKEDSPRKTSMTQSGVNSASPPKVTSGNPANESPRKASNIWKVATNPPPKVSTANDSEFPALPSGVSSPGDKSTDLSAQIEAFYQDVTQIVNGRKNSMIEVYERIQSVCQELFPNCRVEVYGSQFTGLALPNSDIDLVIFNCGTVASNGICLLQKSMEDYDWVTSVKAIDTASVPIIKCTALAAEDPKPFKVDITFDNLNLQNDLGILSRNYTMELLVCYPCLPVLMIVLKSLLAMHNLNSHYHGGLSSYSLVLWVTAYLNSLREIQNTTYADILLGFFQFYGVDFDPQNIYIDVVNGGFICDPPNRFNYVLTVDPIDHKNNTTRSLYEFPKIRSLFSKTLHSIKNNEKPLKEIIK